MKKISLFLSALTISILSMAQTYEPSPDIVVFDFDIVDPVMTYQDSVHPNYVAIGPDQLLKVANPVKDAVNSSEWVGQYMHKSPRQYVGVHFPNQPHSRIYNKIELKYLIPPGQIGLIQYKVITNSNAPDEETGELYNLTLYPTTVNEARFFEPVEGDGAWHTLSITIPSSNHIRALAVGFNSEWSPGGKNPDNEAQVDPAKSGTMCYFDDLKLVATSSEFHTLYFEQFDTPTPYWSTNTDNEGCPQMNGGIQPVSSIDEINFTQLWTGDLYNRWGSFMRISAASHMDFYNIPVDGYNDYEIAIDYGYLSGGQAPYGLTTYMDVSYRESGAEEWIELESGKIEYDNFAAYNGPVQYEGMKAMDLRLSVDTALCGVHLNKIQITGAWDGGPTISVKPVKSDIHAYYNTVEQTLNGASDAKIEVFGLDGSLKTLSTGRPVFSVAHLPHSVYIARISTREGQAVIKFVK